MDGQHLENVIPQVGRCGIWCGSCVVGNGALMELAQRYREMVESHGLKQWGATGFDYDEFIQGLECVSELDVCPGCLSGGGRDECPLSATVAAPAPRPARKLRRPSGVRAIVESPVVGESSNRVAAGTAPAVSAIHPCAY